MKPQSEPRPGAHACRVISQRSLTVAALSGSMVYARIIAIGRHLGKSPHFYVRTQTRPDQTKPDWFVLSLIDMVVRNISQAKAELSALIEEVRKGNEVILAKAGKPVARLVPYHGPSRPRKPGCMAGQISVSADFDSLPDDMAEAFGIRPPVR